MAERARLTLTTGRDAGRYGKQPGLRVTYFVFYPMKISTGGELARRILMALLTWSKEYSVGVKAMDTEHTALFKTLNDLHAAMLQGQAQKLTGPLLRKLLDYTRDHFSAEEALLTSAKYPGLANHRTIHRELTHEVQEFADRFERGEVTLNLSLLTFLRDWLGNHIQKIDKEYGPWLNSHGVH